jgi:predicted aspartyl protease
LAGALKLTGYSLLVAPITLPGSNGQPVDGLLGADLLLDFDLELDLAHHRVGFYTPVDCDSPMLPWAESYSSIVAHESLHRHLFFPVRLDGHDMAAFIDTGAGLTTIDLTAATAAGATAAALEHDRVVTVQGPAAAAAGARLHRFARLDIGGEAIAAPHAIVTRLDLDDADMVLGADFLATHRVWLSYGARRIHVAAPG